MKRAEIVGLLVDSPYKMEHQKVTSKHRGENAGDHAVGGQEFG